MKYKSITQLAVNILFCLFLLSACVKDEVDTTGHIHGIVSDESGTPIQAASVTLTPTGKTSTTGDDGRFEFNDLEPLQYTVSVTKAGYVSNSRTLTIQAGETSKGDMILTKGLPQLKVNISELVFGDTDDILSFEIANSGSGILEWQIKQAADWISLDPTHGAMGKEINTVSVKINRDGLSPEVEHSYTLNVVSTTGGTKEVKVRVRAKIPKRLTIDPERLNFSTDKTVEFLTIKKESGEGDISYSLSADQPWISLDDNAVGVVGEKEKKVKVTVVRSGLTPGKRYTANITLSSDDVNNKVVPVVMEVETVSLGLNTTRLEFPADKSQLSFAIKNPQDTPVDYTISKDASWLTLSKLSGTLCASEDVVTVTVLREGLSAGIYNATITITAPGSETVTLPVTLTIGVVESYESATIVSCDPRINFVIVDCKRSGTSVVLNYTIENTGIESGIPDFRIYPVGIGVGNSEIYDSEGKKYTYTTGIFGTASTPGQILVNSLPHGIKVQGSIVIKNFSTVASQLSLVKMECIAYPYNSYGLVNRFFTFKNVPIY